MTSTCTRCGCRPARPDRKTCDTCAERLRVQNAARRPAKREWERTVDLPRRRARAAENAAQRLQKRRMEDALLVAAASVHGRVPTLSEAADLLGLTSVGALHRRRRVFGLRPLPPKGPMQTIPYPIPRHMLDMRTRAAREHAVM